MMQDIFKVIIVLGIFLLLFIVVYLISKSSYFKALRINKEIEEGEGGK